MVFYFRAESVYQRDNLIKRKNGNLSRQTPRSQAGSLRIEGSVWGGRRMVKMDERPTQRHIVTGHVFLFLFLFITTTTMFTCLLHQECLHMVRGSKVARKRLARLERHSRNGTLTRNQSFS